MKAAIIGTLCVLTVLSASADLVVSTFTGGNPAGGLDFSGTYVYADSFGGTWNNSDVTIGNAVFANDPVAGVSVTGTGNFGLSKFIGTGPSYGDGTTLNWMMHSGYSAWGVDPSIRMDIDVTPGYEYRLHLLFSENTHQTPNARVFDISAEGDLLVDEFTPIPTVAAWSTAPHTGVIVSYGFTATDGVLTIELTPGSSGDPNPIISAMALELVAVPEPSSVALLFAGLVSLVSVVRRHRG